MNLVIGIGTPDHGDDAAGLLVAERVRAAASPRTIRVRELIGDQLGLLDLWGDAREVYVINAVRSGAPPGTVYRFDGADHLTSQHALLDEDPAAVAVAYDSVIEHLGWPRASRQLGIATAHGQRPTLLELRVAAQVGRWAVITLTAPGH